MLNKANSWFEVILFEDAKKLHRVRHLQPNDFDLERRLEKAKSKRVSFENQLRQLKSKSLIYSFRQGGAVKGLIGVGGVMDVWGS
jgi:hypothetical protein